MDMNNKENKKNNPGFSIYEFKKWLDTQNDSDLPKLDLNKPKTDIDKTLGSPASPKVSDSKILEKMEIIEDTTKADKKTLLEEFKNNATVSKSYGKRVTIMVESGAFTIPRFCVRIERKK